MLLVYVFLNCHELRIPGMWPHSSSSLAPPSPHFPIPNIRYCCCCTVISNDSHCRTRLVYRFVRKSSLDNVRRRTGQDRVAAKRKSPFIIILLGGVHQFRLALLHFISFHFESGPTVQCWPWPGLYL